VLPVEARRTVDHYLQVMDRLLPGRVCGLYVVGSTALGAYNPSRSDLDFVVVVDRGLRPDELLRLRLVHLIAGARSGLRAVSRLRFMFPGTCNGVFVTADDLGRPITEITAVASHTGTRFTTGSGFDLNPVTWSVLADHGVAIRGPQPSALDLQTDASVLRSWTLDNLDAYWAPWARTILARNPRRLRVGWRWLTAWGVLGTSRMHHTIATGRVIAKETAGEYALATFAARWHPLVDEALAYRRNQPARVTGPGDAWVREAAAFVLEVVADAQTVSAGGRPCPAWDG
jgi:hypothetical protein